MTAPLSDIKAVVAKTLEDGPIDVLVNYAGYVEAGIAEEARYVFIVHIHEAAWLTFSQL